MPFPFLKLSAELRNHIYEDTLTHDRGAGQTATVALLATCKQVNKEATKLFHSRSVYSIKIGYRPLESRCCHCDESRHLAVTGDIQTELSHHTNESVVSYHAALPSSLPAGPKIRITICRSGAEYFSKANKVLYSLISRLNSAGVANSDVEAHFAGDFMFKATTSDPDQPLADTFFAFTKLHPRHKLTLHISDTETRAAIESYLPRRATVVNYENADFVSSWMPAKAQYKALSMENPKRDNEIHESDTLAGHLFQISSAIVRSTVLLFMRDLPDKIDLLVRRTSLNLLNLQHILKVLALEDGPEREEAVRVWLRSCHAQIKADCGEHINALEKLDRDFGLQGFFRPSTFEGAFPEIN